MKEYVLNYYPLFKCVADECKHTCCAGWEMQIDERSLDSYKNEQSSFGQQLKMGIDFKKSRFKSDKNGRCAFLNDNRLCEIINNLGEQRLCQVCRDHPRFRSFFDDRMETGLGFCCEEATRIILSFQDKIAPVLINDDGKVEELDLNQKNLLDFRSKALDIVQDRNMDINQRIDNLLSLCKVSVENKDTLKILKKFFTFERLSKKWTERLKRVKQKGLAKNTSLELTRHAEHFLVNSLYRHACDAEDTIDVRARTIACVLGWTLINSVYEQERVRESESFDLLVDVVREYSAEVEYSQKNMNKLFSFAYKFIKL